MDALGIIFLPDILAALVLWPEAFDKATLTAPVLRLTVNVL